MYRYVLTYTQHLFLHLQFSFQDKGKAKTYVYTIYSTNIHTDCLGASPEKHRISTC